MPIIVTIILAVIALYALYQYNSKSTSNTAISSPTISQEASQSAMVAEASPSAEDKILRDIAEEDIICDSEFIKNGCRVDTVIGNFAKGIMPDGYWIAEKGDEWQVVVRGNGIPTCEEVDKFSVPKEIYGNCIEKSGDLRFNQ